MFKSRRIVAPLCAGACLLLGLSACSSASNSSPQAGASSTASASASATTPDAADGKLPLGLTEDNKAGDSRPRSKVKDVATGATVNPDGSWTYTASNGTVMTTNADGTWTWKNQKEGTEATLHADGSWDHIMNNEMIHRQVHVNADGTWTMDDRKVGHFETHTDGGWKHTHGTTENTGNADGTAVSKSASGQRQLSRKEWPVVPPTPATVVSEDGVGGESVLPLQPRKGLKPGTKVIYVVPGSEEDLKATAEQEGLLLTDDNKAGTERPRSKHKLKANATVNEDGSWTYSDAKGVTMTVAADGTWTQKDANGNASALHADGSWDEYIASRDETVHVKADGGWSWEYKGGAEDLVKGNHKITVNADGSWRNETDSFVLYGTAEGKAYQEKPVARELSKKDAPKGIPSAPTVLEPNGPGGGGVVPLKPRTPLKAGQKVIS